jgi:MYXO-CTERM domain-containing protein
MHRLFRRRYSIVLACLFGAATSYATAAHAQGTAQLGGWVYIDRNNDGHLAFSNEANPEFVIGGVSISLLSKVGTVETPVSTIQTDDFGRYFFNNLTPGTYVLRETQPIEFVDGIDTLGTLSSLNSQPIPGTASAGTVGPDSFLDIVLPANVGGDGYNFGERGLKAGYASKRYLFASAPPLNTATPEPTSALLALTAIGGLLSWRSSRRRAEATY